ncbi:MAG TPA: hypothetical protein VGN05_06620 [Parvibaculum sp.]|jgi:hypothetical protein
MRRAFSVRLLMALLFALGLGGQARAASFTGNFHGIAAAAGMTLDLQEVGGRVVGRLSAADGRVYALNGERATDKVKSAQGALRLGGGAQAVAFFRLEERPLGIQFLFMPVKADGKPDMSAARDYSFLAQGVAVAAKSHFIAAPAPGEAIDILRFIDEYRQWDPRDVARIYGALSNRDQGLIQLYDHASADVLWRVCSTTPPNEVVSQAMLDELLDRQHTTCEALTPLVLKAQAGGLFPEFLRRARFQFEIIRETALCNRGQSSASKCTDVSALGAPLIVHWRDATSIMRELSGTEEAQDDVQQETMSASSGAMTPYAVPEKAAGTPAKKPAEQPKVETPPLRATISDVPVETRSAKLLFREGRRVIIWRRLGYSLPLRDPRI